MPKRGWSGSTSAGSYCQGLLDLSRYSRGRLALPPSMSGFHEVFHLSMLRKYTPDPAHVVDWGQIEVDTDGTFEEGLVCILDSRDQVLRRKTIRLVRVL